MAPLKENNITFASDGIFIATQFFICSDRDPNFEGHHWLLPKVKLLFFDFVL